MRAALWLLTILLMVGGSVSDGRPQGALRDLLANGSFEKDADGDGLPDGWYDFRGATLTAGGVRGQRSLRFTNNKVGRPARAVQGFALDGSQVKTVIVSLWVRLDGVLAGDALSEQPQLFINFLNENYVSAGFVRLGPWAGTFDWRKMSQRVEVPAGTREAFLTLGMAGATGQADFDDVQVTPELSPAVLENLVDNGDFELGTPDPEAWQTEGSVSRISMGVRSDSCLRLEGAKATATQPVAVSLEGAATLTVSFDVSGQSLPREGAGCLLIFLTADGESLPSPLSRPDISGGEGSGVRVVAQWQGTFGWRTESQRVRVPSEAYMAVLRFVKPAAGVLWVDNVTVRAATVTERNLSRPRFVQTDTTGWFPYEPVERIREGSALDVSFLLDAPAGKHGFVTVRNGKLFFADGTRARFFGVSLLPPTAFVEHAEAERIADRLSKSSVNMVRFAYLDAPLEPFGCLFDDNEDDTLHLSAENLDKLDYFIAQLKRRGIYASLELLSARRFRAGDGVAAYRELPPAAKPACFFDDKLIALQKQTATLLFNHVNPYTQTAYKDESAIALLTLVNESSLFDLMNDTLTPNPSPAGWERRADPLPKYYRDELETLWSQWKAATYGRVTRRSAVVPDRRQFYADLERVYFQQMSEHLSRFIGIPIAGSNDWHRTPEELQSQIVWDYLDDHLYWQPPRVGAPETAAMGKSGSTDLIAGVAMKHRSDKPYLLSEWGERGNGWCNPYEAADVMLTTFYARWQDWDGILHNGVFRLPRQWGDHIVGTVGSDEWETIPFVVNSMPQIFSQWQNAALLFHREPLATAPTNAPTSAANVPLISSWHQWDKARGVFVLNTPFTQGATGFIGGKRIDLKDIRIEAQTPFAAVTVSSLTAQPIAQSQRLLITTVAQAEQRGMAYRNFLKREVLSYGQPPILTEPVTVTLTLPRTLTLDAHEMKVFSLTADGARKELVPVRAESKGSLTVTLEGEYRTLHYEVIHANSAG